MRVFEIYDSINGEITKFHQGSITTFLRLAGCNLLCSYCDTKKAQDIDSGVSVPVEKVFEDIKKHNTKNVTITGGEPLIQREELLMLTTMLSRANYKITIETNGSQFIPFIIAGQLSWIVDYKLPSSRMNCYMSIDRYKDLTKNDFIKFVIQDEKDFYVAIGVMKRMKEIGCKANFALGVCYLPIRGGGIKDFSYAKLLDLLIKENQTDVIVNIQLHKLLQLP